MQNHKTAYFIACAFIAFVFSINATAQNANNQWTWVKGDTDLPTVPSFGTRGVASSSNTPRVREAAARWRDAAGNLWVFGGNCNDHSLSNGMLNDLWKYNPNTNQWTWMSGSELANQKGVYGTKGVSAAENAPGGRYEAVAWTDASGNFWLFGGYGYSTSPSHGGLNDLWKFDISTGEWTWISGDKIGNQGGVYGTKGMAAATNKPGYRYGGSGWKDSNGDLWLFGGFGTGYFNDLWKFSTTTNQWTWISGDNTTGVAGVYGTKGVAAAANKPGARSYQGLWADASGNLWLFGGSNASGALNDLWKYSIASNQWTWMHGDNLANQAGVFGTKGSASSTNKPGGRHSFTYWLDATGKAWIFAGCRTAASNTSFGNDFWRYNPGTNQWTWMGGSQSEYQYGIYGTKGTAAASNMPGSRLRANGWTDASGNLWLFAGRGYATNTHSNLSDLWKYNIATDQWVFVHGKVDVQHGGDFGTLGVAAATNKPGGRINAATWKDASGNFWLFGGSGYAMGGAGSINDLWKFTPSTGMWTWMGGDKQISQLGVYGTKGVEAAANKPGARQGSTGWTDAAGNLWLFGGNGVALTSTYGTLNDLWKYNVSTGRWTWISGDNTVSQLGIYGTLNVASSTSKPGGRYSSSSWQDKNGNTWLFGGYGHGESANGSLNDLWKYNPTLNQWTWMGGSKEINQPGVYGTKGVAAAANQPGARSTAMNWTDASGDLLLFGGNGNATSSGTLNDLWKYSPGSGQWTWINGENATGMPGSYGVLGKLSATSKPGGRYNGSTWNDPSGNTWLFGGFGRGESTTGNLNDLWVYLPSKNQWIWMGGDKVPGQYSVFGTQNQTDPANKPGSRVQMSAWSDGSGDLWLWGGSGLATSSNGYLNDLWVFRPAPISNTLPLTLNHFSAVLQSEKVILSWSTSEEINVDHFVVEKSANGRSYTAVGSVKANNRASSYRFDDYDLLTTMYYRLKSVDKNGAVTYSKVVRIESGIKNGFAIFPNPATNFFYIQPRTVSANIITVEMANSAGHVVYKKSHPANTVVSVDVSAFSKGSYLVTVEKEVKFLIIQ